MHDSSTRGPICLLTDFGVEDNYVGVMKGVIQSIVPGAVMIDLTHAIPPQDIRSASFLLEKSIPFFPSGTVFLCVVDPGVGTSRGTLAIESEGKFFVGPDNGLLSPCLPATEAVTIENPEYRLPEVSNTFHGRDIFAPAAAHLCRGLPLSELGPPRENPIRLARTVPVEQEEGWSSEIVYTDRFGNLVTAFETREFLPLLKKGSLRVETAGGVIWPMVHAYGEVAAGERCAVFGGFGTLELSVNLGNAAEATGLGTGDRVRLRKC